MQYEDFKSNLLNTELTAFRPGLAWKSPLLYSVIKKIAGIVYRYGFIAPGDIFEQLNTDEVLQLHFILKSIGEIGNKHIDDLSSSEIRKINIDMFNITTLVQVFLAGEGVVEICRDSLEMQLYMNILLNFVLTELSHRQRLGTAIRKNYSFIEIEKPIYTPKEST